MADVQKKASPQEVHTLITRLSDEGVINLDAPMRAVLDRTRDLRLSEDQGWYIAGGGGWALVVKSE